MVSGARDRILDSTRSEEIQMNTDKKLAHVVLQTGQLTAMRDWYLNVLDAHVVYENEFLSFMTFDEEHHRVGIVQLPEPPAHSDDGGAGAFGLHLLQPGEPAHQARGSEEGGHTTAGARPARPDDLDLLPRSRRQHGGTANRQLHVLRRRRPSTYAGRNFTPTRFGPSFDPDAMLAALRAGTPESELLTRAWARTCPQRNVPQLLLT